MPCASVRLIGYALLAALLAAGQASGRDYEPVARPDIFTRPKPAPKLAPKPATKPAPNPRPAQTRPVRIPAFTPAPLQETEEEKNAPQIPQKLERQAELETAPQPQQETARQAQQEAASARQQPSQKLFGTVEFRRPLASLPGWLDVIERNQKDPIFIAGRHFTKGTTWANLERKARPLSQPEQLRLVNAFWNGWPYREDQTNWGKADYWAIPAQFLVKSGDCEDYAIVKYFTLKELGFDPASMRIVVLRDTIRNLAHAVLAVYLNGDIFILDNLSNAVLSHRRIGNYSPQYSINEFGRWTHIKGKSAK